jgi:hypothetical protein
VPKLSKHVHLVMANNIYNKGFKLCFDTDDMLSILLVSR